MKALEFARRSLEQDTTPKYVKLQCQEFIRIAEGKDKKWTISNRKLKQIELVLQLLRMPKGLKAGQSLYECSEGYQWLFYTAILCTVSRANEEKRKYETGILEICRKNFKTYTVGTIFILLFLTEPANSKFFSVAPDGALSGEIKEAIGDTLRASPDIYDWHGTKRFKILRDYILFKPTNTKFQPLSYSTSRLDGRLPNAFVADEAGALPSSYPIEAMRSGQINILNKLGCIISTKYPTADNPLEDLVTYSKQVLDGTQKDETVFSLLYEPDEEIKKEWETNDLVMRQANPVSIDNPEIWEDLKKKRTYAIAMQSARENFLTKHCNIVYSGAGIETFVSVGDVKECAVDHIDWAGRTVYVGVDLSMTTDNTSVAIVAEDDGKILAKAMAFIPADRIDEKTKEEKVDYNRLIRTGKVIACGGRTIDYGTVEDYVATIEERMGVRVQAIGFDRFNCLSSAQKWEAQGYNVVEIKQHSSVLHPATKLLKEHIIEGAFQYEHDLMYEINYQNAKCTYDTNNNMYVNKKKSAGKIDEVVATINAVCLLEKDVLLNQMDFIIQT